MEEHIMRIIKYTTLLDEDRKPILVKESCNNYPEFSNLNSPGKITNVINIVYNANALSEEYVWVIALNTKCVPIGIFEVFHGTVNASMISPREIMVRMLLCGATNFVLVHNHPSGDTTPSEEDVKVTQRVKESGDLLNVKLLDHIIIGNNYYSFRENERL